MNPQDIVPCTRRAKRMQRLQGLKKRLRPIPTIAIFSKPWLVFTKHGASGHWQRTILTGYGYYRKGTNNRNVEKPEIRNNSKRSGMMEY